MKYWFLALCVVIALGAGCAASTAVDVDEGGVDVDGGIDVSE